MADTIRALSEAEIRLWVLTGDKIETAITIGYNAAVRATLAHARTHAHGNAPRQCVAQRSTASIGVSWSGPAGARWSTAVPLGAKRADADHQTRLRRIAADGRQRRARQETGPGADVGGSWGAGVGGSWGRCG